MSHKNYSATLSTSILSSQRFQPRQRGEGALKVPSRTVPVRSPKSRPMKQLLFAVVDTIKIRLPHP